MSTLRYAGLIAVLLVVAAVALIVQGATDSAVAAWVGIAAVFGAAAVRLLLLHSKR